MPWSRSKTSAPVRAASIAKAFTSTATVGDVLIAAGTDFNDADADDQRARKAAARTLLAKQDVTVYGMSHIFWLAAAALADAAARGEVRGWVVPNVGEEASETVSLVKSRKRLE